jgi:hypothetical protein
MNSVCRRSLINYTSSYEVAARAAISRGFSTRTAPNLHAARGYCRILTIRIAGKIQDRNNPCSRTLPHLFDLAGDTFRCIHKFDSSQEIAIKACTVASAAPCRPGLQAHFRPPV